MLTHNDLMKDDISIKEEILDDKVSITFDTERFLKKNYKITAIYGINGSMLFVKAERHTKTVKTKQKEYREFLYCKSLGAAALVSSIKAFMKNNNLIINYKINPKDKKIEAIKIS